MKKQFTASVYVLHEQKVLLVHHRKLNKWLQPGGHVDPNETPCDAARREVFEETGLHVELISKDDVVIDSWNAKSLARPYQCLLEEIPEHKNEPAHQHIDLIYLGRPIGGNLALNAVEAADVRWFTLEEIDALIPDKEIFAEIQQTIRAIFKRN